MHEPHPAILNQPDPPVPGWFALAARPSVIRRGLMYALIVGTVLISINHGDALLRGDVGTGRLLKMGLTVMVPYIVSTLSSVGAIRGQYRR